MFFKETIKKRGHSAKDSVQSQTDVSAKAEWTEQNKTKT